MLAVPVAGLLAVLLWLASALAGLLLVVFLAEVGEFEVDAELERVFPEVMHNKAATGSMCQRWPKGKMIRVRGYYCLLDKRLSKPD